MTKLFKPMNNNTRSARKGSAPRPNLCRICGKPVDNGGHICSSCKRAFGLDNGAF